MNPIPTTHAAHQIAHGVVESINAAKAYHCDLAQADRQALVLAKKAGDALLAAKKQVPHGEWEATLEKHWPNSARTARDYARISRGWKTVSVCTSIREALKLLAPGPTSGEPEAGQEPKRQHAADSDSEGGEEESGETDESTRAEGSTPPQDDLEARQRDRQRVIWIALIETVNPALARQLRSELILDDADLLLSVPKSCVRCLKNGPPKHKACGACEKLRNPSLFPAPSPDADEPPEADAKPFALLQKMVTKLAGLITQAVSDKASVFSRRLDRYMGLCAMLDHPPGKSTKFLPLLGVAMLLDMAGREGPQYSDEEVKQAYDKASGGFIPPMILRRRAARAKK